MGIDVFDRFLAKLKDSLVVSGVSATRQGFSTQLSTGIVDKGMGEARTPRRAAVAARVA